MRSTCRWCPSRKLRPHLRQASLGRTGKGTSSREWPLQWRAPRPESREHLDGKDLSDYLELNDRKALREVTILVTVVNTCIARCAL